MGLPINGDIYVWMTRYDLIEEYKDEFKKQYGYEMGIPKTFDELIDMVKFLKTK
ncbi:hypothetical protein [Thermosipho melanesiensis]|uniref:Uncharacterized protein n=1 Tax=Thermosipho melanesiensis (strain DSM 12029 / CIP 104789 / BI429) TaxID=391009 RepID=A6LJX6_THEM4|nr:hypothetical protein [Thermosipho melanesiensis]ABR30227.1 hypothetical protein Tmel_0357 [Thermosipho melanesiensis BI429]